MAKKMIARIIEGTNYYENITIESDEVTQENFNKLQQVLKDMHEEKYEDFECVKCEINVFDDNELIMNYRPDKFNFESRYTNDFYEELTSMQLMIMRDKKLENYFQNYKKNVIDKKYLLPIQQTFNIKEFEKEKQDDIKSYEDIYSYIETILDINDFDIEYNQLNETYNLIDRQHAYLGGVETYKNFSNMEDVIDRLDIYINNTFIESIVEKIQENNPNFNEFSSYKTIVDTARNEIKNKKMSKDYGYDIEIIDFVDRLHEYEYIIENKEKLNDFFHLEDKNSIEYLKKDIIKKLENSFENYAFFELENGKIIEINLDDFNHIFKELSYKKIREELFNFFINDDLKDYGNIFIHDNLDSVLDSFKDSVKQDFYDYSLLKNELFGNEFYLTKKQCELMNLKEDYEYEISKEKNDLLKWCADILGKEFKYDLASLEQKQELIFLYYDSDDKDYTYKKLNELYNIIEYTANEKNQNELEEIELNK